MTTKAKAVTTLDLKGLSCPLPIVKTAQAMKALTTGDVVEVLTTDPGSMSDFPAWCAKTGNTLLQRIDEGGAFLFLIEKG